MRVYLGNLDNTSYTIAHDENNKSIDSERFGISISYFNFLFNHRNLCIRIDRSVSFISLGFEKIYKSINSDRF